MPHALSPLVVALQGVGYGPLLMALQGLLAVDQAQPAQPVQPYIFGAVSMPTRRRVLRSRRPLRQWFPLAPDPAKDAAKEDADQDTLSLLLLGVL